MIRRSLVVLVLLAAGLAQARSHHKAHAAAADTAPIPPQPSADAPVAVKQATTIALDDQLADKIYRVRTAIGYPAYVEFPEAFEEAPACGDCGKGGLFQMAVFAEGHYFAIKPARFPGRQPDGSFIKPQEFVTNVNVRLVSGTTVTLQVELVDSVRDADAKIIFTLPNRDAQAGYVQQQIDAARRQLEAEAAERTKENTQQAILQMIAQPHQCAPASDHARNANIVLDVLERCRFGSRLFFRFRVENRGADLFSIGAVQVVRVNGDAAAPVPGAGQLLTAHDLAFDKSATGVIGFDGAQPASSYRLRVSESGGQGREVSIDDLHF